jgi:hypothetical protein
LQVKAQQQYRRKRLQQDVEQEQQGFVEHY